MQEYRECVHHRIVVVGGGEDGSSGCDGGGGRFMLNSLRDNNTITMIFE